jgi:diguanylate cyclase (GGDEF)-like protein
MDISEDRRQVLVVGAAEERERLLAVFADATLEHWRAREAESFERARFLLQHEAWDVIVVDESLVQSAEEEGLAWLAGQARVPTVFLSRTEAETVAYALRRGVAQWLPRELALQRPEVLAAALERADRLGSLQRRHQQAAVDLAECRQQVHRLVGLLWQSSPADAHTQWFTQRHMMDRLHEEMARAERYRHPLSLALGEVRLREQGEASETGPSNLVEWVAQQIARGKRREDVAGQYGPQGFMLLLVHTPGPGAMTCCQRLQRTLEGPPAGLSQPSTSSLAYFGIASCDRQSTNAKALLRRAEECLERAKADQDQRVVI